MTRSHQLGICLLCISLYLIILPFSVYGQSQLPDASLNRGLALFRENDFGQAILFFENLAAEAKGTVVEADATFWLAKSLLAVRDLDRAASALEYFLSAFPEHPAYPEAFYQKGRLLYLQGEHESSILVLEEYIRVYPQMDFIPNAYYWIGESLYALGYLDEAAKVFNTVVETYPKSFKVEAARYRLSLITFKKRENELMKLLKWSHEETLKTIEEFQRRERAYEQAVAAYQRQIATLKQGEPGADAVADSQGSVTSQELQALQAENARLQALVDSLQRQLAASGSDVEELLRLQELLRIKEETLKLKESLIDWSQNNPESQ
jgi:TolA-binding protein